MFQSWLKSAPKVKNKLQVGSPRFAEEKRENVKLYTPASCNQKSRKKEAIAKQHFRNYFTLHIKLWNVLQPKLHLSFFKNLFHKLPRWQNYAGRGGSGAKFLEPRDMFLEVTTQGS